MEVIREKTIDLFGRKEIVKVSLTIPVLPNKTKKELIEEYGDIGFEDKNSEQVMEEIFGSLANQLVFYLCAALSSGSEFGTAVVILSGNLKNSGTELIKMLEARKDAEKMS